jgi:hypothetical protein
VAALGLKVAEVGSIESERLHGVSNLNAFRDGKRVLRTIMREFQDRKRHHLNRETVRIEFAVPPVKVRTPQWDASTLREFEPIVPVPPVPPVPAPARVPAARR